MAEATGRIVRHFNGFRTGSLTGSVTTVDRVGNRSRGNALAGAPGRLSGVLLISELPARMSEFLCTLISMPVTPRHAPACSLAAVFFLRLVCLLSCAVAAE